MAKHKKHIAIYLRNSKECSDETSSYEIQLAELKNYIKQQPGWIITETYTDEAYSENATKDLSAFNRMMENCFNKEVDYIVTHSISLFAKNTSTTLKYIEVLKKLGIGIYFQNEKLDTLDDDSVDFLNIYGLIAESESEMISKKTKRRVQKSFQQGKVHCPTTYFLGYDTDETGEMVIDEEQAKIVKRIFNEFLDGKGTQTIANGLTEDKIKTARGNTSWTGNAVYKMIKQEKYYGAVKTQKTVTIDSTTHKRVINRDIEPQYLIKNNHPAIISEETFNDAQRELKRRKQMSKGTENNYYTTHSNKTPFSNKFFCGECGRPVIRRKITSRKNGEKYYYPVWQCRVSAGKDKLFKDCKSKYVWKVELEKAFVKILYDIKMNKEPVILEVQKKIKKSVLIDKEKVRINELQSILENINLRIHEIAEMPSDDNNTIYDLSLDQITDEREKLQQEYESLKLKEYEHEMIKSNLDVLLNSLEEIDETVENNSFNKYIFNKIVEKGIIYNNHQITFKFKCGIERMMSAERTNK